jgi:hypothetical protein
MLQSLLHSVSCTDIKVDVMSTYWSAIESNNDSLTLRGLLT